MSKSDRVRHPQKLRGHTPVPDRTVHPEVIYYYCKCSTDDNPVFLGYSRSQALSRMRDHIQKVRDSET